MRITLAYLDAGTGSIIAQAVLGGSAGIALYWRRLRGKRKGTSPESGDPTDEFGDTGEQDDENVAADDASLAGATEALEGE